MRQKFVSQEEMQHVMNGFHKFYDYMISMGRVEPKEIKNFIEPYFENTAYRDGLYNSNGGGVLKIS